MNLTLLGVSGIAIAFLLNHIISQINPFLPQFLNLFSIPIIFIAMRSFEPSLILISATAGVLEDISSSLPVGVNALKKLIFVFLINKVSNYISISSPIGYFFLIFSSVFLEMFLLILITLFFGLKNPFGTFYELLIFQPLFTSIFGVPIFFFFSKIIKKK